MFKIAGPSLSLREHAVNAVEYLPARRFDWKQKKTIWRYQPDKPRTLLESPFLHKSVIERFQAGLDYHPQSLTVQDLKGGLPVED